MKRRKSWVLLFAFAMATEEKVGAFLEGCYAKGASSGGQGGMGQRPNGVEDGQPPEGLGSKSPDNI